MRRVGHPVDVPWRDLTPKQQELLLYGTDKKILIKHQREDGSQFSFHTQFEGVLTNTARRHRETTSEYMRIKYEEYMSERPCEACQGQRLRPEALAVTVGDKSISDITALPIKELLRWVQALRGTGPQVNGHPVLSTRDLQIAHQILKEIEARAQFMVNVGLDYLSLNRMAGSLSGGEAQRIRLATQIGSQLTGVLYVLDEPSIGLHQRDNERLIHAGGHARSGQHAAGGGARSRDDALCRLDRGPGAGRGRARRVCRGRRPAGRHHAPPGQHHRGVPIRAEVHRGPGAAAQR